MPLGAAPTLDINHPAYARANRLAGSGWTTPPAYLDFNALLGQDPMYQGQLSQIGWGAKGPTGGGALGVALAPLTERYNQALIQYGGIPTGVQVDNTLRSLADQSTASGFSTLGRLKHAYDLANSASTGAVAARGLGRSGAVGQHLMENLRGYDINRADAQAQLMETLGGIQQQRAQTTQTALGQAQTAAGDAYDRVVSQIQSGLIANPKPVPMGKPTYTPGKKVAAPTVQRTNPATFKPVTGYRYPQYGGNPGNRFAVSPGRGRLPMGTGYGVPR